MASAVVDIDTNCIKQDDFDLSATNLGEGGFGFVKRAIHKKTGQVFALKTISIENYDDIEEKLRQIHVEISFLLTLESKFIVKFYAAWTESVLIFDRQTIGLAYIFMDLYPSDLQKELDQKAAVFGREPQQLMNSLEFLVSYNMFMEVTEALNYLHSMSPPIMHRDLKPLNVLVGDGTDGQFLKLCDFNLAKAHEYSSHTQLTGTQLYMAPEVRYGRKYNCKADVYSLAVMGLKMFGLLASDQDKFVELIHQALAAYRDSKLIEPMTTILGLLEDCLNKDNDHYNDRKSSGEVLDSLKQINLGDVANVEFNLDHFQNIAFYHRFIIAKLK